jgi:UDP:flavonoid glycosyltransferase YjiC (YdhE family)
VRVLYISGSIGLGHADRDLAIARELRALDPDVEIDWFAGAPARERIAAAGETVLADCAHLDETAHAEKITSGFGFNVLGAIARQRHEMIDAVKAFASVTRDRRYDLVIGDEAYAELEALRRKPGLKRSPFVMIYDCVGVDATSRNPLEHLFSYKINWSWCGGPREKPSPADLTLFIGEPDDAPDRSFGPWLPNRRQHARRRYSFVGYVFAFEPSEFADQAAPRRRLGYDERPLVVCAVGGTAVGADLLRLCGATYPHLVERVPEARMVLVCGPRIDPRSLDLPAGVAVRGYVPNLFEHLAACDAAVVQGGGTTTLELTALRRPFAYFPLEKHFEQEYVASRLRRHGAGVRLAFSQTTPDDLAGTITDLLHVDCTWPPIPTDGASKAAQLIMELVQPGALSRGLHPV